MRPAGKLQSAENNDKRTPRSVSMITLNPDVKRKVFAPFVTYQDQGDVLEQTSNRNRRQDRRLHDQVVNEAAKTAARVESCEKLSTPYDCNDGISSRYESFNGTGDSKAKSVVHSSPPCSLYDYTPGSGQTSDTDSTPLTCIGYDSNGHSVWSTKRDRHEDAVSPSPAFTSVRTSREAKMLQDYSKRLEHLEATSASTSCHTRDMDISTFECDGQEETTQRGPPLVDLINRMSPLSSIAQVVTSIPKECKSCFDKMKSEDWQPNIQTPFNEIKKAARSITKVSAPGAPAAPATPAAPTVPKNDDSMGPGNVLDDLSLKAESEQSRNDAAVWTTKEDSKLLLLVDADMSWSDISCVLEKDESVCKDRFYTTELKDWSLRHAKERGLSGKSERKKKGATSSADAADHEVPTGGNADARDKPISEPCDSYCAICGSLDPGCACITHVFARASADGDGWADGWGDCSQSSEKEVPGSRPLLDASDSISYRYWAIIESDGSKIKIPIDSDNVSGPEKTIATKYLPKVWKWVHDKGLGDKVGLQDAFDLARSMHKNDVDDVDFMTMGRRSESDPWDWRA